VRFKPGVEGPEGVEVLLISSRRGKGHVFPKGGWERDEELREAAARETVEEVGCRRRSRRNTKTQPPPPPHPLTRMLQSA
jgi:8-oxo-dGTP pyrophosphatase MutT (NUDIX family)